LFTEIGTFRPNFACVSRCYYEIVACGDVSKNFDLDLWGFVRCFDAKRVVLFLFFIGLDGVARRNCVGKGINILSWSIF